MKKRISNILYYLQGNSRYFFYYHFPKLLRTHIKEQIEMRIRMMNPVCYSNGTCIDCGCKTTALQMANKVCGRNCYPKFFPKKYWVLLKHNNEPIMIRDKGKYVFYHNVGTETQPEVCFVTNVKIKEYVGC